MNIPALAKLFLFLKSHSLFTYAKMSRLGMKGFAGFGFRKQYFQMYLFNVFYSLFCLKLQKCTDGM